MTDRAQELLAAVREHVNALTSYQPEQHEWADAAADCRELETKLADWRRAIETEAAELNRLDQPRPTERTRDFDQMRGRPVVQGERYELVPKTKNVYTFNDPAILTRVADSLDCSITDAILALLRPVVAGGKTGAPLSLTWKVSYLRSFLNDNDIDLPVADGATSNADGLDGAAIARERVADGVERVPIK